MLIKIYWYTWALFGAAAAVLWLTGTFTMLAGVVLGFVAFGLTFMGMIAVLPAMVHPGLEEHPAEMLPVVRRESTPAPATGFHILKSA